MHVTGPSLAERYLAEGYDLERLPLPAPFDFLATGKDRVAAFASAGRVPASTLVDVRLMARELGARAVFVAASFSDEARRIADRFGIELVVTPPRESEAHAPAPPPPVSAEAVPLHGVTAHDFDEFPTPDELRAELVEVNAVLDPHPTFTPEQAVEVALAESATDEDVLALAPPDFAFLPRELPTHVTPQIQAAEAAIAHDPEADVQADVVAFLERAVPSPEVEVASFERGVASLETEDLTASFELDPVPLAADARVADVEVPGADDLAAWYEEVCALEAADAAAEAEGLAAWYDALLELESAVLAAESAEEAAFADLAPLALHGNALASAPTFDPTPAAALGFREVEAKVAPTPFAELAPEPAVADVPPPFPELVWAETEALRPLAHSGRVLAAEPHFGAPERGAVAFRTVEDAAPELPSFAFRVPAPEPEEAAPAEVPEAVEDAVAAPSPFLDPASVLPWTPRAPAPVAGYVPAGPPVAPPAPPAEVLDPETGAVAAVDTPRAAPRAMLPWTPSIRLPGDAPARADPALFADAFAKAQAWSTVQRIEGIRQEARDAVHAATDVPKPRAATQVAPDADFELL